MFSQDVAGFLRFYVNLKARLRSHLNDSVNARVAAYFKPPQGVSSTIPSSSSLILYA